MPKVIDAKSWQLTPASDGRRYSKYPDGDTGLAVTQPPDFDATEGEAANFDLLGYANQSTTVAVKVGSTLPVGWTLSSGTLLYNGSGAPATAAVTFVWTSTISAQTAEQTTNVTTVATPVTPTEDIEFLWTHQTENLGVIPAGTTQSVWLNYSGGGHGSGEEQTIVDTDQFPDDPGRYVRHTVTKTVSGDTYRSERRCVHPYINTPEPKMTRLNTGTLGSDSDHYVDPKIYWYGFKIRVDNIDDERGSGGSLFQWHEYSAITSATVSPLFSLWTTDETGGIRMYSRLSGAASSIVFRYTMGVPFSVIWQVRWDTRPASFGGSTGLLRLWVGPTNNPTLQVERINNQTCFPGWPRYFGTESEPIGPYIPWVKTGIYKADYGNTSAGYGVPGDFWRASYRRFAFMGNDGNLAAMIAAVNGSYDP